VKLKTIAMLIGLGCGGIAFAAAAQPAQPVAPQAGETAAAPVAPTLDVAPKTAEGGSAAPANQAAPAANDASPGRMGTMAGRGMAGYGLRDYCRHRADMGMKNRVGMGGPMGEHCRHGTEMQQHCKNRGAMDMRGGRCMMGSAMVERHREVLDRLDRIEKRQAIIETMLRELLLGRQQ